MISSGVFGGTVVQLIDRRQIVFAICDPNKNLNYYLLAVKSMRFLLLLSCCLAQSEMKLLLTRGSSSLRWTWCGCLVGRPPAEQRVKLADARQAVYVRRYVLTQTDYGPKQKTGKTSCLVGPNRNRFVGSLALVFVHYSYQQTQTHISTFTNKMHERQ